MAYIGNKPANKAVVASDLDPAVITGQTALAVAPADTDEFLISDAGVLKRLDASLIGSQDFVKIQSTTVSSNVSSVTLTGFDDSVYASYLVRVNNAITELTGTQRGNIKMRVNTSGGVQSGGSDYQYITGYIYRRFDNDSIPSGNFTSEGDDKIVLNGWSLSANDAQNTEITFANPQSTSHAKIFNCSTTYWKTSTDGSDGPYIVQPQNVNGIYTQTTALTGLTFLPEANSATAIAGGNFCLYGLKK